MRFVSPNADALDNGDHVEHYCILPFTSIVMNSFGGVHFVD